MDVYAVGIMLWEMMTGTESYWQQDAKDGTNLPALSNDAHRIDDIRDICGEEMADTLLRSWAPDPADRPTAEEFEQVFAKLEDEWATNPPVVA